MLVSIASLALPVFLAQASPPSQASRVADAIEIVVPDDGDAYSAMVTRAQSGDAGVDFLALRRAYLGSAASERAAKARAEIDQLREAVQAGVKANDPQAVREAAVAILGLQYIDLDSHKYLRQSCAIIGDETCASRHHFVEFGLLKSILASGDGRSCAAAWNVVTIEEEYFILNMRGYRLKKQQIYREVGKVCDRLDVVDEDGKERTVYFDVTPTLHSHGKAPSAS